MGAFQTLVTIVGLIGIVALLLLLFCRYLGGWTRTRTWVTSSREEKMVLTRAGVAGHYNPNGFMVPSDSDLNLSGGGSFRRFDKTDHDYQLLRQGSATSLNMARQPNIPPQPLRPAPLPPPSHPTAAANQFQNQGSVDSVFTAPNSPCPPPRIPPPPNTGNRNPFPSLSSTNPFLPLIQASTQFFSQTLQSFQTFQQPQPQPPTGYFQNTGTGNYFPTDASGAMPYSYGGPSQQQQNFQTRMSSGSSDSPALSGKGGVSMGELLFSSPPMYSPAPPPNQNFQNGVDSGSNVALQIEPLLQLPVLERGSVASVEEQFAGVNIEPNSSRQQQQRSPPQETETDTLINMEPSTMVQPQAPQPKMRSGNGREIQSEAEAERNSLLETMRAEIRLENKRMEDATKSLMMEEIGIQKKNSISSPGPATAEGQGLQQGDESNPVPAPRKTMAMPTTTTAPASPLPPAKSIIGNNNSNGHGSGRGNILSDSASLDRPSFGNADRKYSAPEIGGPPTSHHQHQLNDGGSIPLIGSASPSCRTRSFSLRQASVDSIGDMSDLSSPDSSMPALQRAMSCDSVCSDTSVVLGDFDAPHSTGQLCVGLEYDSETADLIVNVIEGKELVGLDPDPSAPFDSYVRVYLLPDKTTNMQTRVYRKSLSPVYKEKFMFGLEETELPMRSLVFYLYATNKFSNTLIGEAELKLTDADIKQPRTTWLSLTDTGQRVGELGEIIFSLSYLPTAERLTVVVVKARNLKFPHQRDTGDPFVKVYLLQRGKKVSKKKSSTKRAEKNPIFNEAMIFSVPTHALQTIQLRISVSDSSETEGRAYSIGHVIVGSVASGKPLSHWNQMLSSLRKPIAMWHSLRK